MSHLRSLVDCDHIGEVYILTVERYGPSPTDEQFREMSKHVQKVPKHFYREMGLKNPDSLYIREDGRYWLAPINPSNYLG